MQEAQLQQHKTRLMVIMVLNWTGMGAAALRKRRAFIKEKIKVNLGIAAVTTTGIYETIVHRKPPPVTADEARNVIKGDRNCLQQFS